MNLVVIVGKLNDMIKYDQDKKFAYLNIRDRNNAYGTNFFRCKVSCDAFEEELRYAVVGDFYQLTGYLYQSKKMQLYVQVTDLERISVGLEDFNKKEILDMATELI